MITVAERNEKFLNTYNSEKRLILVYGLGDTFRKIKGRLDRVDFLYDARWKELGAIDGIEVSNPEKIREISEKAYLIICINNKDVVNNIIKKYRDVPQDVHCFVASDSVDFIDGYWDTFKSYEVNDYRQNKDIKVNIVCSDNSWIFSKFATRIKEQLIKFGYQCTISEIASKNADINHHIPYAASRVREKDTLMITHVDCMQKVDYLKEQLETAGMGICMSKHTMNSLISYGIRRDKLCYINPAHDENITPKKYVIGISHKCRDGFDIRKREGALVDILERIDPAYFRFVIMGDGWNRIIDQITKMGFETEYIDHFDYDLYPETIKKMDYFLYLGFDEGTMGYLDALQAGIGTIVTPQGYHLDTSCPIDYPCETVNDFREALLDLENKRKRRVEAVKEWTWTNYVKKHMDVWDYILHRRSLADLYSVQLNYEDGINSAFVNDNRI